MVAIGQLVPVTLAAQADSARPPAVVTRGDLRKLAIGAGLAVLAYQADPSVRREVRSAAWQRSDALGALADLGNGWGQPGVVALGVVLWGGGFYTHHRTVAAVGLRGLEAITVSSLVTKVLKGAIGRARPRVSPTDAWDVEFGRGFSSTSGDYESMPSGHATAAFAFAAAVTSEVARRAPEHARLVGVTTFGLAGATAYARLYRDAHWGSDVTMGAAIGTVGGWAVTRWHATRPGNRPDAILLPLLVTTPTGRTAVGVSIPWR
jgi:membrane-associated phospholipid phosphatase